MNFNCFFQPFPVIEIDEISLREISIDDFREYYAYMNNIEMKKVLSVEHIPSTLDSAQEELRYWRSLFREKRSIYWGIVNEQDELIGTAGFNNISFKNLKAEISYDLSAQYWGRGYMLKAIKSIIDFAQHQLGLVRIQATVTIENDRSIKLLERCGFLKEGLLEKYEIVDGKHKDYFIYSKILT
ncbi:MAG: hypothetical protein DGJ47_000574 [Rickettsiaceae bacterium]